MIYCGTGHSYTQTGTPVVWRNQAGSVDSSNWHTPGAVEAVWDEHGARCLGATRITGTLRAAELRGVLAGRRRVAATGGAVTW